MKKNMHIYASPRIFRHAKTLRRDTTPVEQILWEHLRDRKMEGEIFRRQHPGKKFVLDFYCYKLRLGIALDGQYHSRPDQQFYDNDRTEILDGHEVCILRISNEEVIHTLDQVLTIIRNKIFALRENCKT